MQPNQQDPNNRPLTPPAPPVQGQTPTVSGPVAVPTQQPRPGSYDDTRINNVPDYLHLEPIVDPAIAAKKKKKRLIVVLLTLLFVAVATTGALAVYAYMQHNTAQEKFYKALDAQMTVGYVAKKTSITPKNPKDKSALVIDSKSDFSDIKNPKTTLAYVTTNNKKKVAEGEITYIGDAARYASLSMESDLSKELGLAANTWYKAPEKGRVFNRIFDTNRLGEQLNVPVGLPMIGSYDAQGRAEAIGALKESKAFVVKELKNEAPDTQVYTIAISPDKAYGVYTEFANKQKSARVSDDRYLSIANLSGDVKLWFNSKENRFTKVMYVTKFVQSKSTADVTIDFSYPPNLKVDSPESSQDLKIPTGVDG